MPGPHSQSPVEEAADALLNKGSKLLLARGAVLTQDLQALAAADRAKVRRLEDKLVFGEAPAPVAGTTGADVGDIIVCDDYTVHPPPLGKPPGNGLKNTLLAAALLAGGAVAAGTAWQALRPQPSYDAVTYEQSPDGTWKEVKRERIK